MEPCQIATKKIPVDAGEQEAIRTWVEYLIMVESIMDRMEYVVKNERCYVELILA